MRLFTLISCLFFLFVVQHGKAQEISDYSLSTSSAFTLQIQGLGEAEGELRIAVFDSEQTYTKEPIYAVVITVDSVAMNWKVENLPFGEYAIAVYHDKNTNGKLDTNFLGIPKERYGFSNNARGKFGPASWKDSFFEVKGEEHVHEIVIK